MSELRATCTHLNATDSHDVPTWHLLCWNLVEVVIHKQLTDLGSAGSGGLALQRAAHGHLRQAGIMGQTQSDKPVQPVIQ